MEIQMKKNRNKVVTTGTVLLLCLIAALLFAIAANSVDRKLAHQLKLGQKYLDEMDYEQAIVALEAAIEIDPMSADAYIGAAVAYVGLDDMDEAITVLEKGYELTDNEEILGMLEELRESKRKEETGEMEEVVESLKENVENTLPYFELGFSPEDFTIAGYSVLDGDHLDDVEQAATAVMPNNFAADYEGWYYNRDYGKAMGGDMGPRVILYYHIGHTGHELMRYQTIDSVISMSVSTLSSNGVLAVNEFPLYEGKIIPNMMSYEETLDILGIGPLIQDVEETGYIQFESQYGTGECMKSEYEFGGTDVKVYDYIINLQWGETQCTLSIGFHDNVLCGIGLWSGDMANEQDSIQPSNVSQ